MKMEIWHTIEKNNSEWTVWMNKKSYGNATSGSGGCRGLYTGKHKKDCVNYCKEKGIKYEKSK